jgi:hypothetical protein
MRNQERQSRISILYTWFVWIFILTAGAMAMPVQGAGPDAGTPPPPSPNELRVTLSVEQKPLADLLAAIQRQCDVEVTGLKGRFQEPVTFSAEDEPVETAIKRLLRNLDETNYAFFYNLTHLRQVSVLPKSKGAAPAPVEMPVAEILPETGPEAPVTQEVSEKAVRVIKVNTGTQAEALDLRKDDLVVEYDGVRIQNSQQLVSIVKQKSEADTVEMVVVRDGQPLQMTLNGGLIVINVKTVAVSGSELGQP